MIAPDVVTVAVSRVDGGVTVVRVIVNEYVPDPKDPTQRVRHRHYEPTEKYVDSLIAKYVSDGHWVGPLAPTSWRFVANDYVDETTDRYFRNAWKDAPGRTKPDVDMPKAREIHRTRLRRMRTPLLEALDVEYARAEEEGLAATTPEHNVIVVNLKKKQAIIARKQALRDITADPAIEAAQTPEELKAVIPEVLRG
jgi:hypothetical protein